MVPESELVQTEHGLVPKGQGWFIVNARDSQWWERAGRGVLCEFEGAGLQGAADFPQVGINVTVLGPGEPMSMYHWETDQEDFLVLAGEALAIVEGVERPLKQWDFVHCPPGTNHVIVGAGEQPCVVLAVGARERSRGLRLGRLHRRRSRAAPRRRRRRGDDRARRGVRRFPRSGLTRYRAGWLPDLERA